MQTNSDNQEYEPSSLATWLAQQKPATFATSLHVRIGLGIYGIVLPVICFLVTAMRGGFSADWQSGRWADKLSFVLSGQCGWPIFPLLIYSMISMGAVIRDETNAFQKAWVRFGVFSGTIVCSWYLFVFGFVVFGNPITLIFLLLGAAFWILVAHGLVLLLQTISKFHDLIPLITTIVGVAIIVLIIAISGGPEIVLALILAPCLLSLLLSTPLAFLVYFGMSIRILKVSDPARRFSLLQLMGWVTWCVAFASALQLTIKQSFTEYSRLPLEPAYPGYQDCYVATAAAKGYRWIVGSQSLPTAASQPVIVNQQLAIFKAAELTLRAISPSAHRWFRFIYNRLGPRAAAKLSGPLSATVAYLGLKPAEWLCRIALRILLGHRTYQLVKELYLARAKVVGLDGVE